MDSTPQQGGASGGAPPAVLALAADLMFASRIRGSASAAGVTAEVVTRGERLVERAAEARPRLILVDLDARQVDAPALIRQLKAQPDTRGIPVVGFVSHVNASAIAAAREAGADQVLARSKFVQELPALLRGG